jgi:hypothetical protein
MHEWWRTHARWGLRLDNLLELLEIASKVFDVVPEEQVQQV